MRHPQHLAVGLTAMALLAAGCGSARPARHHGPAIVTRGVAAREPGADPRPYGLADTAFGLDVLGAWCRTDPQANIVFSPESLTAGLGQAYLGARGSTAQAMARVLHLPSAGTALLAGLQARSNALRALNGPGVTLAGSDQVWADPSLRTRRGYLNDVATGYGAGVQRVPLLTNPDRAAQQIDAGIAAATRGHIRRLLTPANLKHSGWVLTDALYLNADWATPFQASRTSGGQFRTAGGQRVSVRYLNGDDYRFDMADGWTAVSLPYRGGRLSMIALLPDSGSAGSGAAGSGAAGSPGCPDLQAAALSKIINGLAGPGAAGGGGPGGGASGGGASGGGPPAGGPPGGSPPAGSPPGGCPPPGSPPPGSPPAGCPRPGSPPSGGQPSGGQAGISLPKVHLTSKADMTGLLTRLGMGIAFGPAANFTGLSPQAAAIATVMHAATLQVGEKGTIASAATAVGIAPATAQYEPRVITFDRPYVLMVTDTATGEPLFLARVANPLAS